MNTHAAERVEPALRVWLSDTTLRVEYDRICRGLLERAVADPNIPDDAVLGGDWHPRAVQMARDNWRHRMRQEHHSSAVFAGMLPQMIAANASADLKMCALRSSLDELRHAVLCGQVVRYLGGDPSVEAPLLPAPIADHPGIAWHEKVVRNLLFVGCISETIAVAVLSDERDHARDPHIEDVLRQLAGDESLHARIGWIHLRAAWPTLDDEARARTNEYLAVALAYYERSVLDATRDAHVDDEVLAQARALGFAHGPACREIIYAAIDAVVVPQLDAIGLDGTGAWKNRHAAAREVAGDMTITG